jgi:hypothetical protein
MILRAIFFIGLAALLIPHEPDLGFGRPGGAGSQLAAMAPSASSIGALIQSTSVQDACKAHAEACAGGLSILDNFQSVAIRSMDQVRADLAANRTKLH